MRTHTHTHTHTHTQTDSSDSRHGSITSPSSGGHLATPTSTAPPTQMVQAMYDQNGQPVYILQNIGNQNTALIPLQLQQHSTPSHPTLSTVPTSLKIDQSMLGSKLHTPSPGTPKNITVTQTYTPPNFDALIQQHGRLPSEAGPIRHGRQAAKERPSPVAFDGECLCTCLCVCVCV